MKKAAEDFNWDRYAYPLSVGGAIGTSLLLSYLTKKKLENQIASSQAVTPRQADKMVAAMGLPTHLPIVPYEGKHRNAFYASPSVARRIYKRNSMGIRDSLMRRYNKEDKRQIRQRLNAGLIAYHPDFMRKNIIAHELGHAHIQNRPWYSPSRMNQGPGRTMSNILGGFSPLATLFGAGTVGAMTYNKTKSPVLSGLAGGATGLTLAALMNAPTLLNEHQASNKAREYLRATSSAKRYENENDALKTAYRTYLLGALAVPTLYGAAVGGVGVPNSIGRFL